MSMYSYTEETAVEDDASQCTEEERVRAALGRLVDEATAIRLATTFKALGDPTRVRIVSVLADRELRVSDLTEILDTSQSAVSHQLRTLRDLRLVRWRRDGQQIFYTLDDEHVIDLFRRGLEHVEHG